MKLLNKSKQAGFAMIEVLLMIGVLIALTAVMVYALFAKVSRQSKVQTASEQMVQIASSVRAYAKSNAAFCHANGCLTGTTEQLENQKYIVGDVTVKKNSDQNMTILGAFGLEQKLSDQSLMANPWGGAYTVDGAHLKSNTKETVMHPTFDVSIDNLPTYMKNYVAQLQTSLEKAGDSDTSAEGVQDTKAQQGTVCKPVTGGKVTCTFNA